MFVLGCVARLFPACLFLPQIVILRDIFHVDRTDPRVLGFAARILELCVDCAEQHMGIE
jgi:hypothetical protein